MQGVFFKSSVFLLRVLPTTHRACSVLCIFLFCRRAISLASVSSPCKVIQDETRCWLVAVYYTTISLSLDSVQAHRVSRLQYMGTSAWR